jgi:hypothetical protein
MPISTRPNHSRRLLALLLVTLAAFAAPVASHAQSIEGSTTAQVARVTITIEPGLGIEASEMTEAYGPVITEAWPQFAALFDAEPYLPQHIAFVHDIDPANLAGMRWVNDFTWVSPDGSVAVIAFDPFVGLTPSESANVLRNVVSRGFVQGAARNAMPVGLLDGIARYMETPILARQARVGSLVQGQYQAGVLPDWEAIAWGTAPDLAAESQTANAYALVAFLIDRYGVGGLRDLVSGFASTPELASNLTASLGQDEASLAPAWDQFLPRWFATGWRDNAVSAFDLSRAQELERSQRLFSEIGDEASLSRVEILLALCATGLQADALMLEAQSALEAHDYPGVITLVTEAERLYGLLPEAHRPTSMIAEYTTLASNGLSAAQRLEQARVRSDSWLNVSAARNDAVAAGDTFAALGDESRAGEASAVVNQIDQRIARMRMVISALVLVLAAWLAAWLWLRAPARLQWHRPLPHARAGR